LARRRKPTTRRTRGSLNENAANNFADLPYVNEIIELGGISIGVVPPLTECVAVAHEGKHTLAMLVRRKGETGPVTDSVGPARVAPQELQSS
jgi:hypothetical protein